MGKASNPDDRKNFIAIFALHVIFHFNFHCHHLPSVFSTMFYSPKPHVTLILFISCLNFTRNIRSKYCFESFNLHTTRGKYAPRMRSAKACTWKEVVQPEQHKTGLGSGCPACSKGKFYLEEPVSRK